MANWLSKIARFAGDASSIVGAIGTGAGLLKSLFGGNDYEDKVNKQNEINKDFLRFQTGQAKELTMFQNEQALQQNRQMPVAQKEGLMAAGVNPAVMAGGVSPAQGASPSAGSSMPNTSLIDALFKKEELDIQRNLAAAQVRNINADTENKNEDTQNKVGQGYIQLYQLSNLMPAEYNKLNAETQQIGNNILKILSEIQLNETQRNFIQGQLTRLETLTPYEVEKYFAETEKIWKEYEFIPKDYDLRKVLADNDAIKALAAKMSAKAAENQAEVAKFLAPSQKLLNESWSSLNTAQAGKADQETQNLLDAHEFYLATGAFPGASETVSSSQSNTTSVDGGVGPTKYGQSTTSSTSGSHTIPLSVPQEGRAKIKRDASPRDREIRLLKESVDRNKNMGNKDAAASASALLKRKYGIDYK